MTTKLTTLTLQVPPGSEEQPAHSSNLQIVSSTLDCLYSLRFPPLTIIFELKTSKIPINTIIQESPLVSSNRKLSKLPWAEIYCEDRGISHRTRRPGLPGWRACFSDCLSLGYFAEHQLVTRHHSRLCDLSDTNETRSVLSGNYGPNGMIKHDTQTGAKVGGATREKELAMWRWRRTIQGLGPKRAKSWCPWLNYGDSECGWWEIGWESRLGLNNGELGC